MDFLARDWALIRDRFSCDPTNKKLVNIFSQPVLPVLASHSGAAAMFGGVLYNFSTIGVNWSENKILYFCSLN